MTDKKSPQTKPQPQQKPAPDIRRPTVVIYSTSIAPPAKPKPQPPKKQ